MTLVVQRRRKKLATALREKAKPSLIKQALRSSAAVPSTTACLNATCPDPLSGKLEFHAHEGDTFCLICGEYQNQVPQEQRSEG